MFIPWKHLANIGWLVISTLAFGQQPPFSHEFQVEFVGEPKFPVHFVISPAHESADPTRFLVRDATKQRVSCELLPGFYRVMCEAQPESGFFDSQSYALIISQDGRFSGQHLPARFLMPREIEVLVPAEGGTIPEKNALLSWKGVPGAHEYRLEVIETPGPLKRNPPMQVFETEKPIFTFPDPLNAGSRYQVNLLATHPEGEDVGKLEAWELYVGEGTKAKFEELNAPDHGGFLGVLFGTTSPMGAIVFRILPGTTAEAAGLRPNDVITKFGGELMADVSTEGFAYLVRTRKPGEAIEVEVQRGQTTEKMTIEIMERPEEYRR